MNFYNFILKKYFDLFSFKKSDLYKLLKKNYYQFYVKIKFKIKKVISNLLKKTNKIKFEKLSPQKSIFPFLWNVFNVVNKNKGGYPSLQFYPS